MTLYVQRIAGDVRRWELWRLCNGSVDLLVEVVASVAQSSIATAPKTRTRARALAKARDYENRGIDHGD